MCINAPYVLSYSVLALTDHSSINNGDEEEGNEAGSDDDYCTIISIPLYFTFEIVSLKCIRNECVYFFDNFVRCRCCLLESALTPLR